ncbi:hypothetical protein D3C73_864230 [compost metagenome]
MLALGKIDSFDVVSSMIGSTIEHNPIKEHSAIYNELLPIYIRISRQLTEEYDAIAKFQRNMNKIDHK